MDVSDMKPAEYNPRNIGPQEFARLSKSLGDFGDISGLTWNRATGNLVSGHQRLKALQAIHGAAIAIEDDIDATGLLFLLTPDGARFPVRVVDWDIDTEKAANIAANSLDAQGQFDDAKLRAMLDDLKSTDMLEMTALAQDSLQALMSQDAKAAFEKVATQPNPKTAYVLIGLPFLDYQKIADKVMEIAAIDGVTCEVAYGGKENG